MTDIDVRTGEVVDQMTEGEARAFVDYVRTQQEELPRRIVDAWRRRADQALGYTSWDAMCDGEGLRLRLGRDERPGFVMELRSEGMSIPAIASATGSSVGTVHSDLSKLKGRGEQQPETVTSLDGRQRPATQPPRARGGGDADPDERRGVAAPSTRSDDSGPLAGPASSVPPQQPKRDLGDVLEERMPGTRADLQRTALRARWSKDMAAVADIDLLDMDQVRAAIDDSEANLAIRTLRGVADRLERAGRPGLRIVGGTDE